MGLKYDRFVLICMLLDFEMYGVRLEEYVTHLKLCFNIRMALTDRITLLENISETF